MWSTLNKVRVDEDQNDIFRTRFLALHPNPAMQSPVRSHSRGPLLFDPPCWARGKGVYRTICLQSPQPRPQVPECQKDGVDPANKRLRTISKLSYLRLSSRMLLDWFYSADPRHFILQNHHINWTLQFVPFIYWVFVFSLPYFLGY